MSTARPIIIITGSTRGIGLSCLKNIAFSRQNVDIVMTGSSREALEREAKTVQSDARFTQNKNRLLTVEADLSSPSAAQVCDNLIKNTLEFFGAESSISSVVLNAGVLEPIVRLGQMSVEQQEQLHRAFSINVFAPFHLTNAVLRTRVESPQSVSDQLRLVFTSSGLGTTKTMSALGTYCATKAALNQLMKVVAIENPDTCISVAMSPGPVDTDMQVVMRGQGEGNMSQQDHQGFVNLHRTKTLVTVEDAGTFLAALAMNTPREWSGHFVDIREDKSQKLVQQYMNHKQE